MQFGVPQFIDVEDKIFGPFTWKQFLYLAGGAGLGYLSLKFLPGGLDIIIALGIASLALSLTFLKINDKPFEFIMRAWISYMFKTKLYIWKQQTKKVTKEKETVEQKDVQSQTKLTGSKLKDLAWSLDVLDMKNRGGK